MTAEVGREGREVGGRGGGGFQRRMSALDFSHITSKLLITAAARRDGSKQTVTLAVQLCNVLRRKRGRNRKCLSKQQATSH